MKRKKAIITVAAALAVTLGVTTVTASAASLGELRDQISEKQSELEEGREREESLSWFRPRKRWRLRLRISTAG